MTRDEYDHLCCSAQRDSIRAVELENKEPRVLIYGYQLNRETFSLELIEKDGVPFFRRRTYRRYPDVTISDVVLSQIHPDHCIPNKRAYPERCDYDFCMLLIRQGTEIPFTTFTE